MIDDSAMWLKCVVNVIANFALAYSQTNFSTYLNLVSAVYKFPRIRWKDVKT